MLTAQSRIFGPLYEQAPSECGDRKMPSRDLAETLAMLAGAAALAMLIIVAQWCGEKLDEKDADGPDDGD